MDISAIGQTLPPGKYRYEVAVSEASGKITQAQTFTRALVEGVRYGPAGPVLTSGAIEISLANIVEILGA